MLEHHVVSGVAVQALLQPLLVREVADEANAAAEDEETVKRASDNNILRLVCGKKTAVSEKINKAECNATIHNK